jgi:hypothetical protein
MRPSGSARCGVAIASLVVAGTLAGCATSHALALAQLACEHVSHSISDYQDSLNATNPTTTANDQSAALLQLRYALTSAALAAGQDGQWQALMTTLAESSRVPEADLIPALEAQCQTAEHPSELLPSQVGPSAPPGVVAPSPPSSTGTTPPSTTTP